MRFGVIIAAVCFLALAVASAFASPANMGLDAVNPAYGHLLPKVDAVNWTDFTNLHDNVRKMGWNFHKSCKTLVNASKNWI